MSAGGGAERPCSDGAGRGALLRRPVARARGRGGHRDERQDDDGVPAPRDPRGRRAAAGAADEHRAPHRRRARPTGLNTPESIDLQRLFREMLDAGDRSCAMEATSIARHEGAARRDAVRGPRLHEPDPGPPRLPRDDGGLLRRKARALRSRPCTPSSTSATSGGGGSPASSRMPDIHPRRRPRRGRPEAARPLQPRQRARRGLGGAGARDRRGRDPRGDRLGRGRAGALRVDRSADSRSR